MKHLAIKITGRVQGVFFRASTKDKAEKLAIKGFVRNDRNNSVYIEAEGTEENLKQFIEWCHRGPDRAEVKSVIVEEGNIRGFTMFEVKR